jgi:hypothetical protein
MLARWQVHVLSTIMPVMVCLEAGRVALEAGNRPVFESNVSLCAVASPGPIFFKFEMNPSAPKLRTSLGAEYARHCPRCENRK